jgi:hypothetical protein
MNTPSLLKFRASIFTAVLAVATLVPALHAQDANMAGKANVPFAFETANQHFEPGSYIIRMETPYVISIEGKSGTGFVLARPGGNLEPAKTSKIVFHRTGDKYFLAEVWVTGKAGRVDVVRSKAESQLEVAGKKTAPSGIAVAMLNLSR